MVNFVPNFSDSIELEASNSSSNSSGVMSLSSQESDKSKDDHVLDVYQTVMENEGTTDTQKAIVREMCNVVWRVMDKKKWICENLIKSMNRVK